ncbi:alpha/beta hydrolase [Methylobacterium sp. E-045]|uniref:alpha/beta hydrolase n=1 Tax=Methylobacterium sp. E-045 TaxID=2836575 RepID=UPI001FB900DD|nr:alpha/beta hydrolase [Methylobacterium sp. E-045]MCJ2130685.1 alpha/beta hydrolase [Methylobacterium sp. E-045]
MPIIDHDEHLLDRAAMVAMRGFMKLAPAMAVGPEGREAYDALIEKTPTPEGVEWVQAEIGGVPGWLCRPADAVPGRAVLFLHGGCYVLGSATAYRGLASQLAARVKGAVFVADYRLAPEHPFPAAFDDARQALDGMAAAGFDAVAVAGDSAGGGLALALVASGAPATRAVGAAMFSPWIDLSLTGETMQSRADVDPILSRTILQQGADQYLRGADSADPRVNAMHGKLASLPPVRIDVGDDEVLLADALRFEAAASGVSAACDVHVWKGMVHVFPSNVAMLKAAPEALDGAGAFLEAAFSKGRAL